jgi:hypothetical protein
VSPAQRRQDLVDALALCEQLRPFYKADPVGDDEIALNEAWTEAHHWAGMTARAWLNAWKTSP